MEMLLRTRDRGQARNGHRVAIVGMVLSVAQIRPENNPDETAIRRILDNEVETWNKGDTDGYSRDFAADVSSRMSAGCSSRDIRRFETATKLFSKANSAEPR